MSDDDLVKRPLDEVFDTQREVERNPCGAWQAIQSQANRIEELEAKLAKAVEALEAGIVCTTKHGGAAEFLRIARTTLAELKGEDRG
jgi:hypothetical protein